MVDETLDSDKATPTNIDECARQEAGASPKIGLALSGGGSRAIAFHLGAMRALDRVGLLSQVSVLSTVSGGSVIGALWARSAVEQPFDDFEVHVRSLLKRGLVRDIVLAAMHPKHLLLWLGTVIVAHPINATVLVARGVVHFVSWTLGLTRSGAWKRIQPPFCRWASRTTAFERSLRKLFPGSLADGNRDDLELIVNSCELRTGTAFRFSKRGAANYQLGKAEANRVSLATAVAASAAFPPVLPALDLRLSLGGANNQRVLLTDGGVYDNLGISALDPAKDPSISALAVKVDFILCSSAGLGRPSELSLPYWLLPRLLAVTGIQFRKLQDSGMAMLHAQKEAKAITGFALAYLGQNDQRLDNRPADFIPRERVNSYPTNFSAMKEEDINALVLRGDQVMTCVLRQHCGCLLGLTAD